MTLFFRRLAQVDIHAPELAILQDAFYRQDLLEKHAPDFAAWLARWSARVQFDAEPPETRRARMDAVNPCYVLRNYLAQQAIEWAEQGDSGRVYELLDVLRTPYCEQHGRETFSARRPDWARYKAGCSMLSCSS